MAGGKSRYFRAGAIALALLLGAYVVWSYAAGWAPSREEFPVQGIVVSEANGKPEWARLGATGVDFAYITAVEGARGRDRQFAANLEGVQQAGIRFGALHHFDICRLASDQATLFITTVPRSDTALPPAVQLDFSETCKGRPNRELILSELATFLSQIEAHSGRSAILLLTPEFEQEYRVSSAIDRTVWLEGNWFLPDYSARPWVMWTANTARHVDGVDNAVRWAVVRK
ncbi:MAG TPA: GH25 family lysozyme [Sphingorhabdus sp.]|jgi:lysozyme|nr:GH25 family lysozyme [Sphingorhabdus sp.]